MLNKNEAARAMYEYYVTGGEDNCPLAVEWEALSSYTKGFWLHLVDIARN